MSELPELALPCQTVTLKMIVGPEVGVTTLEDLVARAVLLGAENVTKLRTFFRLPERVMVDVISTLWTKGFISVDFADGTVSLTDDARKVLVENGSLAGKGEQIEREFVYEPITRRVMVADPRRVAPRPRATSVDIPARGEGSISDVSQAELIDAVQAAISRERADGFTANVLKVSLGHPQRRENPVPQWLHVPLASVQFDIQTKRLRLTVADHRWEPVAPTLSAGVADLVDQEPDSRFAQRLRALARSELLAAESVSTQLDRMGQTVDGLTEEAAPQRHELQRVLASRAIAVQNAILRLRRERCDVTPVLNEGHGWTVDFLLRESVDQLVIVTPRLEYEQLEPLLPELSTALARGVRLVVLWGRAPREQLSSRTRNAMSEMIQQYPDLMCVARTSCKTNACLMIQDNQRALVSSQGVMGHLKNVKDRVSVLVEPAADGPAAPEVVSELLEWTRREFPDWQQGKRVLFRQDDFGRDAAPWPVLGAGPLPRWPTLPEQTPDETIAGLWAEEWRAYHQQLCDLYAEASAQPTARALFPGRDREMFAELTRSAKKRLVVVDDHVDQRVADPGLASFLRSRRQQNVDVHLIHPPSGALEADLPFFKLSSGAHKATVRHSRPATRAVIADHEMLLGSFSTLADFSDRFGARHRRKSQVSVYVRDQATVDEVAAILGVRAAAATPDRPSATKAEIMRPAGSLASSVLREARQQPTPADFGAAVVQRLTTANDPWQILNDWRAAGGGHDELKVAELRIAAAAVLRAGLPGGDPALWLRWLIGDAWRRAAFVEAGVMGGLLNPKDAPLAGAALLAVTFEVGPLGAEATLEPVFAVEEGPSELRAAGAVAGIAEAVLWGGASGLFMIESFKDTLPQTWQSFAELVMATDPITEGPLPIGELLHEQTRLELFDRLEAVCARIVEQVEKLEMLRQRFNFDTGQTLYRALFAADGLLTRIRCAAASGVEGVRRADLDLPLDVHAHVDGLIKAAGMPPMAWAKQMNYLRSITSIVQRAEQVRADADKALGGSNVGLGPRQVAMVEHVESYWEGLFGEIELLDQMVRPLPLTLLERLQSPRARSVR